MCCAASWCEVYWPGEEKEKKRTSGIVDYFAVLNIVCLSN